MLPPLYIGILVLVVGILRLIFPHLNLKLSDNWKRELFETMDAIVFAGVTALFLITYIAQIYYIPSESMVPTLKKVDCLLVSKLVYRLRDPKRGEVIIFRPPETAHARGKEFVKRLIGLPGDNIAIKDHQVIINNIPLKKEDYLKETMFFDMDQVKIPQDHYFVMGDNRNNSDDSRYWGFLPRQNIDGKALFVFFPPWRIKGLKIPAYPELNLP